MCNDFWRKLTTSETNLQYPQKYLQILQNLVVFMSLTTKIYFSVFLQYTVLIHVENKNKEIGKVKITQQFLPERVYYNR